MDSRHPGQQDASGHIHVNLGSGTPCRNDDTEANIQHRDTVAWSCATTNTYSRSSLVSRHTRLRGRVVESAGIRSYRERSGPDRWHNRPGVDGVVADKAQTHCPRLERLVPKVLKNRKCLDTYELLNSSII